MDDLLSRFGNKKLGDTIARVGRNLSRKLGEHERFFGAARFCAAQGVENKHILLCLQAALGFGDEVKTLTLDQLREIADAMIVDDSYSQKGRSIPPVPQSVGTNLNNIFSCAAKPSVK